MNNNELIKTQSELQGSSQTSIIKDKIGYVRPVSFSEAIGKGSKTMLTIRKEGGIKNLTAWVVGRLIGVFNYLGAYNSTTDFQFQMLAQRICAKYFYLTPGELDYFFVCFENGEYRKLFNNGKTINPQDIMMSLIDYEKDLLEARGRIEEKRRAEEKEKQKAEEAMKPHGLAAWKLYCEKNGLDPNTHKPPTVSLEKHDTNKVLHPDKI